MKRNRTTGPLMAQIAVPAVLLCAGPISAEGKPMRMPAEWFNVRRPEITGLFGLKRACNRATTWAVA